jgi:uncharacterized protein YcbX
MSEPLARIAKIWRFPVKSMAGESLAECELTLRGVAGDRLYAFESSGAPPGMLRVSGAERRELLRCQASIAQGATTVRLPGGTALPVSSPELITDLGALLPGGHRLHLSHASEPQTDCRPLALISLQTIAALSDEVGIALDPRRFRANLVLDFAQMNLPARSIFPEDALVGRMVRIGDHAVIRILERDPRCRFITFDPETTEPLLNLMKVLNARHDSRAGIYASIVTAGVVRLGDLLNVSLIS